MASVFLVRRLGSVTGRKTASTHRAQRSRLERYFGRPRIFDNAMKEHAAVRLTVAEDGHARAVAAFFRAVWDPAASEGSVRRARALAAATNPVEPGIAPPSILALHDERVIGIIGSLPARFWNGADELPGYWLRGLNVLPEFRGGPIGFSLVREAARRMPRSGALTVALAARRLFGALGYRDIGLVSNYVRILRGSRVAARIDLDALGIDRLPAAVRKWVPLAQRTGLAALGGGLIGGMLRLRAAWARATSRHHAVESARVPDPAELDALWRTGRPALRAGAVRDSVEFDLRYGPGSGVAGGRFRYTSARKEGHLTGVAVVREPRPDTDPRLAGIAVATLSDVWFDPTCEASGLATLRAAEQTARALGADALLCSTGHPVLAGLLRRQGYLRAGGNMHLLFRDAAADTSWPTRLEEWWVSRGDARSDDTF